MSTPFDYANSAADNLEQLAGIREYEWPADVYDVLGGLRDCALAMEQVLATAWTWLRIESAAGRVGLDALDRADPGLSVIETVADALSLIEDGEEHSRHLAEALNAARQITSHLTGL